MQAGAPAYSSEPGSGRQAAPGGRPGAVSAWRSPASVFAVSRSRVDAFTSAHRSSLLTRLLPCSVRYPRTASSSRMPALTAPSAAAGGTISSLSAQSTAWLRYSAPRRNASARSSATTDDTPRGQNSTPTTTLTAHPMATSSIRSRPTVQPTGTSRLKSTTIVIVKAACPTRNGVVPGAYAATATATGSATHSDVSPVPIASSSSAPSTNPTTVPASARHAVAPVEAALVRSTDKVPSTTQNACCTPDRSATATAAARASAPRRELRNHTERTVACLVTTNVARDRPATLGERVSPESRPRPFGLPRPDPD